MELPHVGLGTWELRGDECIKIVEIALDLGYRHIDTAQAYKNHRAIAKAIKNFDRKKLYITSKIELEKEVDIQSPVTSVRNACEKALKELDTDYLDLYLIHWPEPNFPLGKIFETMEKLVSEGKILKAGVSNYTIHHLEDLRKIGCTPFANQVEFHPYLYQKELLNYCQSHQIQLISFRPFGFGKLIHEEPLFKQIGDKYSKTGAQVILRWLLQKNVPVVPKASSKKHLRENLQIFDFSLTEDEMAQLDGLNRNQRYCMPDDPRFLY